MPDEVTYLDMVALSRIKPDTVVERFGGLINSSYFDASNILGTLKQKKLIDFTSGFPGQSAITVTNEGKQVLGEAAEKTKEEFDHLDLAILTQISNGKRTIVDLGGGVNVRPRDLAMHLNKLNQLGFSSYELRNGNLTLSLTELGFNQVKKGMPIKAQTAAQAPTTLTPTSGATVQNTKQASVQVQEAQAAAQAQVGAAQEMSMENGKALADLEMKMAKAKKRRMLMIVVLLIIIIAIVAALALKGKGVIPGW